MFEIDFATLGSDALIQTAQAKLSTPVEDWERLIWQFTLNWFDTNITTIQIYTSGSTGAPKQITHTKTAMLNSAAATCKALDLKPGNRALLCLPINKIAGMMMVVRCIYNNMVLVCIKPNTTPLQQLPEQPNINFAAFTPMQFHEIATNYSSFKKADYLGKVILGGEDVRAELLLNIQKLESEIYITFGMTETISHIALKRLNGPVPDKNFKVLPGIYISADERGCMVIKAPALEQPHLVTNDAIKLITETEFEWLGRVDNVINSGGLKIHPEEIEQQLSICIEAPFFIASLPDKLSGEKLILALEMTTLKPEEIAELDTAFSTLEKLHRPKQVVFIPQFVRTANGKIKRKESLQNIAMTMDV